MRIDIKVDLNIKTMALAKAIEEDDALWMYAATEWHRLYKKYVPMESGQLRDNVTITPGQIVHEVPYAHYQYAGIVYEPSYPITQGGIVVGFFSPKNRKKNPTSRKLKYKSPSASKEWDKAAEATEKAALVSSIQRYIDEGRVKF